MGTNFFRKRVLTTEDEQLMNALKSRFKDDDLICDIRKIHIGKRSGGWQFCFDHNDGKYYDLTKEDFINWVNEPNYEVVDENDKVYTQEEFWKMVEEWNKDPNNYRVSEMNEQEQWAIGGLVRTFKQTFPNADKYTIKDAYVLVDDFRFAVFTDFL